MSQENQGELTAPPTLTKFQAPICLSGNGVRRPNTHGVTKMVKMGGLAGAEML